jgi:hypothetical protein
MLFFLSWEKIKYQRSCVLKKHCLPFQIVGNAKNTLGSMAFKYIKQTKVGFYF